MAEMTKAERKAALKAAKAAEKAKKKEAQNAGGNDKVVETKKEETKEAPQVNNQPAKQPETKQEAKKADPPKKEEKKEAKAPNPPKKAKEEKIPTLIPEEAGEKASSEEKAIKRATALVNGVTGAGIPIGSSSSSPDGKAMLAFVMQQRYANNEELEKHYPELYHDINRNIDVVTLLALVDIRQDLFNRGERGELELISDPNNILRLQSMAELLGIKLSPAKALPNKNGDTQMAIDFAKAEVPEELSKDAGKRSAAKEVPELDPNKVNTSEELTAALTHLTTNSQNIPTNIVNAVEWYRNYCILKADTANKKLEMDDKSVADWLNDIFTIVQPQSLLKGLGRAVYLYTSQTGSPCMAHAILHPYLTKAGWSEDQVASTLKALIQENFRYKLANDEKKELKPSDDKALQALVGTQGNDYINKLLSDFALDIKSVKDDEKNEAENSKKLAAMTVSTVRKNYFPKDSKPSTDEVRMAIGRIINLYRDPADRLAEYCQDYVITPKEGEYPEKASGSDEKKTK